MVNFCCVQPTPIAAATALNGGTTVQTVMTVGAPKGNSSLSLSPSSLSPSASCGGDDDESDQQQTPRRTSGQLRTPLTLWRR